MGSQPFFIFAAKLCPADVEASMFALFMGLSNFGKNSGYYLGSFMLDAFGGVSSPDYTNLSQFVLIRSLMRLGPILIIPFLVPTGRPRDPSPLEGSKLNDEDELTIGYSGRFNGHDDDTAGGAHPSSGEGTGAGTGAARKLCASGVQLSSASPSKDAGLVGV